MPNLRLMENAGFQIEAVELIDPSSKTTNRGVGGTAWKRVALRMVGEISAVLRMSDRMMAFGRKPGVQASMNCGTLGGNVTLLRELR